MEGAGIRRTVGIVLRLNPTECLWDKKQPLRADVASNAADCI